MDQASLQFLGAAHFSRTFLNTSHRAISNSFKSQPHNNTTHKAINMDQQWPFLGQIYVFFSTFFDVTCSNITITYYVR